MLLGAGVRDRYPILLGVPLVIGGGRRRMLWIFGWARIDIEDEARVFLREIPTVLRLKREDRGVADRYRRSPKRFL